MAVSSPIDKTLNSGKWRTAFLCHNVQKIIDMLNKKETAGETAMKVYTFNQFDHELRVAEINGEPWFVAKDVCASLGIVWRGSSTTLSQIPDNWQGVQNFSTPGGTQQLRVISEAGLYKLAFRCQSSEIADRFTNKVASEILPSIRKTGRYEAAAEPQPTRKLVCRRSRSELVNADLLNLLWLIGESLRQGEIRDVALELGVSRQTVSKVLNGYARNARVLMALYNRAKANRACGMIYHRPDVMAERLIDAEHGDVVVQLPGVVYGNRKRGGQPGNSNARKSWRKEVK